MAKQPTIIDLLCMIDAYYHFKQTEVDYECMRKIHAELSLAYETNTLNELAKKYSELFDKAFEKECNEIEALNKEVDDLLGPDFNYGQR